MLQHGDAVSCTTRPSELLSSDRSEHTGAAAESITSEPVPCSAPDDSLQGANRTHALHYLETPFDATGNQFPEVFERVRGNV